MSDWIDLPTAWGDVHREARMVVHHALQIVAAAGATHLDSEPELQRSTVGYEPEEGGFVGRVLGSGCQLGLGGTPPHWRLYRDGRQRGRLRVAGQTVSTGATWSRVALRKEGLADTMLELPTWDLPPGPFDAGTVFPPVPFDGYLRLQAWYANSLRVLTRIQTEHGGSPVRVWPHRFDIATRLDLEGEVSLDVGMSPGSSAIDEPYLYAGSATLLGSVLPGSGQEAVVRAFFATAIASVS